jgi:WD40 repeat protein
MKRPATDRQGVWWRDAGHESFLARRPDRTVEVSMSRLSIRRQALAFLALGLVAGCSQGGGGAGEVRDAFAEYRRALQERNAAALSHLVVAAKSRELTTTPNADALLEMMAQMAPEAPEITALDIDGEEATLKLVADMDGQAMSGTVRMRREAGRWKLDEEHWSIEMSAAALAPEIASRLGPGAAQPIEAALLVEAHEGGVTRLAFTPDGSYLASIGYGDHKIRLWDLATESLAGEAVSEHRPVDMALTPDGSRLVVADAYGWLTLWPISSGEIGEPERLPANGGRITRLAVNRDGSQAATTSWDGPVAVWDLGRGRRTRQLSKRDRQRGVAFSPTSPLLVTGSAANDFTVWNLESSGMGSKKRVRIPKVGEQSDVWSVAISPDGRRLVTGHMDASITVWDLARRQQLHNFFVRDASTRAVGFSPDGSLFATAQQDGRIHFWESASARRVGELHEHECGVESIAFAPGGSYVFAAGGEDGKIILWQ